MFTLIDFEKHQHSYHTIEFYLKKKYIFFKNKDI